MGLWSKLTNPPDRHPARTPAERRRRNDEIRRIDKGTASWLRRGGTGPRKDR